MRRKKVTKVNYWQSYSDMMTSLLMLFILLVLALAFINKETVEQSYKESSSQISDIINIKKNIISQLKEELNEEELGISINEYTGEISFDSNILFDIDSSKLKPQGKEAIDKFLPKYLDIMLSENNMKYLEEITVVGHTDNTGEYKYNLGLSQDRALSVVNYIVTENGTNLDDTTLYKLQYYIGANGKASSRPVIESGRINYKKSRRVEFKFELNDEKIMEDIETILNNINDKSLEN